MPVVVGLGCWVGVVVRLVVAVMVDVDVDVGLTAALLKVWVIVACDCVVV